MKPVRLARLAQQDVAEAQEWYDEQRPGMGSTFVRAVDRVLINVGEGPRRFPIVHHATRRAMVGRFPYGIFFVEKEDYVQVVAVTHLRMTPLRWQARG